MKTQHFLNFLDMKSGEKNSKVSLHIHITLVEVSYNVRTLVMNKRNRLENAFFPFTALTTQNTNKYFYLEV